MFIVLCIGDEEINFVNELLVNRFSKKYFINLPIDSIRQNNPFDALVCCVIYRLLHMGVLQFDAYGLGLQKQLDFAIQDGGQVAVSPANGVFRSYLLKFVITKNFRKHLGYNDNRIRLINIARFSGCENSLKKTFDCGGYPICDT